MVWDLQSYPTTVLNERMWHFLGSKHTLTPPTNFHGVKTPNPRVYAPGVPNHCSTFCSIRNRRKTFVYTSLVSPNVCKEYGTLLLRFSWHSVSFYRASAWTSSSGRFKAESLLGHVTRKASSPLLSPPCNCKPKFSLPGPGGLQGPASQGPRRPLHEWPPVKSAPDEKRSTTTIH